MPRPTRFDLDTLEFGAVRELLVDRLQTALGRGEVERLGPASDGAEARRRLDVVAELAVRLAAEDRPPLTGAVEVRSWLGAFFTGDHQPDTRDLAELKRLLRVAARCRGWLSGCPRGSSLAQLTIEFPAVDDLVLELDSVLDDRGEVLDSASVKLSQVRQSIIEAEAQVRSAMQRFVSDERMRRCLQSPEPTWRHGRPVFQVRYEQRQNVPGVLHDRSQSGATVFIEPQVVVEAANRLADARSDEHREIQVVLTHIARGLRRCQPEIEGSVDAVSRFDVSVAAARLVTEDGYRVVPVRDGGVLRLRRALHPLLLRSVPAGPARESLVPLDLTLGDPYSMLVITGPNTGGKTVALKTVGLLSIMARSGLPIPADEGSEIPDFDGVFVDIGDEQGIAQSLSTFSSHVTRIARCLDGATARSLVLLDEVGAGTDPEEGGALGAAVLEELERRGTHAVVTTHIGRLKDFAYTHRGAENGAMAFDGASLRPLYRLDVGIPGASHALDIAARVGLDRALVDRARELLGARDERLERVIQQVQSARQQAEEQRRHTERLRLEADRTGAELEQKHRDIDRQRAWLAEEADALVAEQLRMVRERLDPGLRQLQNAPSSHGQVARDLLTVLGKLSEGTSVQRRRLRFLSGVKKGDDVFVARFGRRVRVHRIDRVKEVVSVDFGKMRIDVPFEDVSWIQPMDL